MSIWGELATLSGHSPHCQLDGYRTNAISFCRAIPAMTYRTSAPPKNATATGHVEAAFELEPSTSPPPLAEVAAYLLSDGTNSRLEFALIYGYRRTRDERRRGLSSRAVSTSCSSRRSCESRKLPITGV